MGVIWKSRVGGESFRHADDLIAALLRDRGVVDIDGFLRPRYDVHIDKPERLAGVPIAADRIMAAIFKREPILIYGDYDADGITSTAILYTTLKDLGANVTPFLPHRQDHGYGLNQAVLEEVTGDVGLVIAVDCGVTAVEEVFWLNRQKIDTIIVDHHTPPAKLPAAVAVVHPNHPSQPYSTPTLCGAGTAWKLACALLSHRESNKKNDPDAAKWLLDLAAIGTLADMVPLQGENRTIVQFGLEVLRRTRRPGLRLLMREAGVDIATIRPMDLSFSVIPRLNAPGRLDHPQPALDVVLATDEKEAQIASGELTRVNKRRQTLTTKIVNEAERDALLREPFVFAHSIQWPSGVVGLAASKLARKYNRPAFVIGASGNDITGSVRSPDGVNVVDWLRAAEDLLVKFGGHPKAAGFTVADDQVEALKQRLLEASPQHVSSIKLGDSTIVDASIDRNIIDLEFAQTLEQLAPFGEGNSEPLLAIPEAEVVAARYLGKKEEHVKLTIATPNGLLDAIWFSGRDLLPSPAAKHLSFIAHVQINSFRGRVRPQLVVHQAAPSREVVVTSLADKVR